ncbi:MAG: PKD domain-containing protein [Verrucomicrobiales bacterium]
MTYTWKVGDREMATGQEAAITLKEPGDFRVELTVTDAKGAASSVVVPVTWEHRPRSHAPFPRRTGHSSPRAIGQLSVGGQR